MIPQQNHAVKVCTKNRCVFRKREMHRFFFLKKVSEELSSKTRIADWLFFWQSAFYSPQDLEAYVAQEKALALFETGGDGIGCEKTLTLVTCSKAPEKCRM